MVTMGKRGDRVQGEGNSSEREYGGSPVVLVLWMTKGSAQGGKKKKVGRVEPP